MNIVSVIRGGVLFAALLGVPMENSAAQVQTGQIKQLAGVYTMSRASAAGTEVLTLTLSRDKGCTLKTSFPASKTKPAIKTKLAIEKGAWKMNGRTVVVDLTRIGTSPEMIEIIFELQGDVLVATKYDQSLYGTDGLHLKRQRNVR